MNQKLLSGLLLYFCIGLNLVFAGNPGKKNASKPNIIYIMLDEVGYYEPSYMQNKKLLTPNIDQLASEGMIFTNAYAGASLCAPTRVCLMTGKHMGHTSVRSNEGGMPIRAKETTVASMLKQAGYATGGFGKWGCGNRGTSGVPETHGFDTFFGYYDQVHAHSYFPEYLIRNSQEVPLKGNVSFYEGETHAQEVIFEESKTFIREHADEPFFCYLPWTPPHGLWGMPDNHPSLKLFENNNWNITNINQKQNAIGYAALLHMTDQQIGELIALLQELNIDDNTIIFFSGDNGGADYFSSKQYPRGVFEPNVSPTSGMAFRGKKGTIYEGGLKIPMAVRYPGHIQSSSESDLLCYFPDFMATIADLIGIKAPVDCDGLSILPTLLNENKQKQHKYLFWTANEKQALRSGDWKLFASRQEDGTLSNWELYNLRIDPSESNNLAAENPRVLKRLKRKMEAAYEEPAVGEIYDQELFEKDHNLYKSKSRKRPGN